MGWGGRSGGGEAGREGWGGKGDGGVGRGFVVSLELRGLTMLTHSTRK